MARLGFPRPRRRYSTTFRHGYTVDDPYSWLRDGDNNDIQRHLAAERKYYEGQTKQLRPLQDALLAEASGRVPTDVRRPVSTANGTMTWRDWGPEDDHGRITRDPAAAVLLDLEEVAASNGSDHLTLGIFEISPDGAWLAWSADSIGDEAYVLRFRDLQSHEDSPTRREKTAPAGTWDTASSSFYYVTLDAAARPWQVWRHRQSSDGPDECILSEYDERFRVSVNSSADKSAVIVRSQSRDTSECWYIPASAPDTSPRSIGGRCDGVEYSAEPWRLNGRAGWLLVTNADAPEFRLMWVDEVHRGSSPDMWVEVRSEQPGVRLLGMSVHRDFVVLLERAHGTRRLNVLTGGDLAAQGRSISSSYSAGTVTLDPPMAYDSDAICVRDESLVETPVWYLHHVSTGGVRVLHQTAAARHDTADYVTRRVTVAVPGTVPVPATVVSHCDTPMDGSAPALVYGYGAYELVFEPYFDPSLPSLLDRGIVFVHAHVRGGGEQGRAGWLDGRLGAKQHSFDDFLSVADGISDGRSAPGVHVDGNRLIARGMSAGGLLVAAALSQRPDRWRAVLAEVPFVDVVNSMCDPTIPLIVNEYDEWGDPADPEQFAWIQAYSPYENLPEAGRRPDVLVSGSVHDTRVLIHEPAKWVAALRHSDPAWAGRCLFRCELGEGSHSHPPGRIRRLGYEAEIQAWMLSVLEVT